MTSDSPTRDAKAARRKATIRDAMRARLAALTPDEREAAARKIARRVLQVPEVVEAPGVLSCLSFGTEPDTWRLIEQLMERGIALYVPRAVPRRTVPRRTVPQTESPTEGSDPSLHVHPWPCRLETLSMGLRQPRAGEPEVPAAEIAERIGAALVLGLAFDPVAGWRLGHGAGHFDRFLAAHRSLPAVALAFECQLVDDLPAEPHDIAMDLLVTEERVLRPRR